MVTMGANILPLMGPRENGSLPKKKIFFRENLFLSVSTQMQVVVTIYYKCIVFLLPFNADSMCNSQFAS